MSTNLNDLSLFLDSKGNGLLKRITEGLNHLRFDGETASMFSALRQWATDRCVFANE